MNGMQGQLLQPGLGHQQQIGGLYSGGGGQEAADYWTGKIPGLGNGMSSDQSAATAAAAAVGNAEAHKLIGRPLSNNVDPLSSQGGWGHSWNQHQA